MLGHFNVIILNLCLSRYYANPLVGEDADDRYVLHFYDLPAKKSFSLYIFRKAIKIIVEEVNAN
jgi:hypothetical protein